MDKAILDPETLKTQDKLTPEQEEEIQQNVLKEFEGKDGAEDGKKSAELAPKEKDTGDDEGDEGAESTDDKEDKSKDAKEAEEKAAEEEEAKKKAEEDGKGKEPTEEEKKVAAEAEVKAKEDFEKNVQIYKDEHSISEEQAREELESSAKIQDKYEKDPQRMAAALLHLNRAYSDSQYKLKQFTDAPKEGELVINGKKLTVEESREKMVEMYRKAYPKLSEDLDDEKVHELAVADYKKAYVRHVEKQEVEVKAKATEKRDELLKTLKDEDKPFLKDIKAILDRTEDGEIFAKDFEFSDYVYWARGRNFHKTLKEREEAAYKRGLEQKKILGAKPEGGAEPKGSAKADKTISLTEADKTRALAMYESLAIPEAEKFKMFMEFKKGE